MAFPKKKISYEMQLITNVPLKNKIFLVNQEIMF